MTEPFGFTFEFIPRALLAVLLTQGAVTPTAGQLGITRNMPQVSLALVESIHLWTGGPCSATVASLRGFFGSSWVCMVATIPVVVLWDENFSECESVRVRDFT